MKAAIKIKKKKKDFYLNNIKKNLKKNNACYVLITCSQPSQDGEMQVELNYSGDENLASYLIDGAQNVFESEVEKAR
ncbi:MAG: hypothetical protein KR126chlam6_01318 [Candidatus Anoxychlamydiales bacterium]|nr:hypothetical protein [Candidatus Anoxychlamydiales bacterium]